MHPKHGAFSRLGYPISSCPSLIAVKFSQLHQYINRSYIIIAVELVQDAEQSLMLVFKLTQSLNDVPGSARVAFKASGQVVIFG
jgi:hypothetical protein